MLTVPLKVVGIALAIHILWGANPVAVKVGLEVFPPLSTAFFRFLIGVICVAGWALAIGVRLRPTRAEWPILMVIGGIFTTQIALMNVGYGMTTGAMGAILTATNPLFGALFAHFLVRGDRLTTVKSIGLFLAFFGTAFVLLRGSGLAQLDIRSIGNILVLASAMLLGFRLILSVIALQDIDEFRVNVWQMLIALPLFGIGAYVGETIRWENLGPGPVLALAYQGVVLAGVGFTVLFVLMKRYPASIIVSFNFVSPIAGVLLSVWLLGESLNWELGVGVLFVAAGLYLIARRPASGD